MRRTDLLVRAARLAEAGEPFVLATVVRRTPPSSARTGYKALVDREGGLHGWLGGSCIEPVVRREAVEALRAGEPRLLVFSPEPDREERPGVSSHRMTCHSGGTVEVYLEPELPAPLLCLYGDSPVNRALAHMARPLGWRVRVVAAAGEASAYADAEVVPRETEPAEEASEASARATGTSPDEAARGWAVVATMGEWDESAVERALAAGFGYVGMVGSPRRASEVGRTLGLDEDDGRLVSPAGLDVGAREPAEIAVTILAEILQRRAEARAGGREPVDAAGEPSAGGGDPPAGGGDPPAGGGDPSAGADDPSRAAGRVTVDPVCQMEVAADGAAATAEHDGTSYHFCSDGCRRRFEREPARFL